MPAMPRANQDMQKLCEECALDRVWKGLDMDAHDIDIVRPTREHYSFIVERELMLEYNRAVTGYQFRTISVGDFLWFMRSSDSGHAYFIDMDGAVGSVLADDWRVLRDTGVLRLTNGWVSREAAISERGFNHASGDGSDVGDALQRLQRT